MIFLNFPYELRENILLFITDKNTILNARKVCREWYHILKNFNEYFDYNVIVRHYFEKNKYVCRNLKLNVKLRELEFGEFGKYIYKEYMYNGTIYKKIESFPPFKIIVTEFHFNTTYIKEYDTRKDEIKKIYQNNYPVGGPCIIS